MERITVIKATKRKDLWDFNKNKPIEDTTPIGFTMDIDGAVPESFIKWTPNKIFDKRKYPELYALFGKDHLPNDTELKCFVQKNWENWYGQRKKKSHPFLTIILTILSIIGISLATLFFIG